MLNLILKLLLLSFLMLNTLNVSYASTKSKALKVGFMGSIKRIDNGNYVGVLPDIMREAVAKTDYSLILQAMPIKRLLKSLELGKIDVVIGLYKREERLAYADYLDQPVGWICTNLFKLKSNTSITENEASLFNKKIGVLRGASLEKKLRDMLSTQHVIQKQMPNYEVLVNTLKLGRFDAVIATNDAFKSAANNKGLGNLFTQIPLKDAPDLGIYVLVSKESVHAKKGALVNTLNQALETMAQTNRFRMIYKRNGKTFDEHCKL